MLALMLFGAVIVWATGVLVGWNWWRTGVCRVPDKLSVCVDFDGVVHVGGGNLLNGAPGRGVFDWITTVLEDGGIQIYVLSELYAQPGGRRQITLWLRANGMPEWAIGRLRYPVVAPRADVYVSARSWRYDGDILPSAHWMRKFRPFYLGKVARQAV